MYFSVSLLFKQISSNPLWEERIILIDADSEEDAHRKGELIGNQEAVSYKAKGTIVEWRFECIERVYVIEVDNEVKNGTELFSRFLRDSEVKSLLTPFDDEE
ncbi:MAG: DUF4288 domain-containing protein [Bacteroidetes bacterium]|nr:DUF4288 domain-containing protein [Bacteroidota bacterium]